MGEHNVSFKNVEVYSYLLGHRISFDAYVYKATIGTTSEFSQESPFGRSSKIYTYGGTSRDAITLSFYETINAKSFTDAVVKMKRMTLVTQAMYPGYGNTGNSLTLKQAPLLRVYVKPIISNGYLHPNSEDPGMGAGGLPHGLLCYCTSFNVDLDRTHGAFAIEDRGTERVSLERLGSTIKLPIGEKLVFPSKIIYTMVFLPIEEIPPGFYDCGEGKGGYKWNPAAASWPIGVGSKEIEVDTEGSTDGSPADDGLGADAANVFDAVFGCGG